MGAIISLFAVLKVKRLLSIRKYTMCFYWSFLTLTTIGGSSDPETNLEYMFTGLTFFNGVFVFAAVVGNVGDVISNMNAARTEFQAKVDDIKRLDSQQIST